MTKMLGISIDDKFRTFTALALIPLMIVMCGWACNVQTVVDRVNSILVEVGPALQVVVALLPLLGAKQIPPQVVTSIQAWIPQVQQDVASLDDLIKQYGADLAANPTAQSKINALITTTENDLTAILPVFHVLDATTQQKVTAIVTAIAAAISSVESIVNAASGKVSVKKAASTAFISSGKDFKTKFNAILKSPTGDPVVDLATTQVELK